MSMVGEFNSASFSLESFKFLDGTKFWVEGGLKTTVDEIANSHVENHTFWKWFARICMIIILVGLIIGSFFIIKC